MLLSCNNVFSNFRVGVSSGCWFVWMLKRVLVSVLKGLVGWCCFWFLGDFISGS